MAWTRRSMLRVGCGVFVGGAFAGCIGDSPPDGSGSETETRSTSASTVSNDTARRTGTEHSTTVRRIETRETTTDAMTSGRTTAERACNGARHLSFYALQNPPRWTRRTIYVAYSLGTNASVLLVAFEGNTILGTADFGTADGGVAVDGQPIRLDEPLTGEHTIRVVMYTDEDGDGKFEPENATPCRYEGEVIQAGPETIDFSEFATTTATAG